MVKCGIDTGNKRELELANKCIVFKGIWKFLEKLDAQIVENRIYHSFLNKNRNKFWCFIISSLPLTDYGLDTDDVNLEEKILPSFLSFDILYFYRAENETDTSPSQENIAMSQVLGLEKRDDSNYFLIIDLGEEKVELMFEIRGLRDKWMELLKNSRKTQKDIAVSITKKPRNLNKLNVMIQQHGIEALKTIADNETTIIDTKYVEMFHLT